MNNRKSPKITNSRNTSHPPHGRVALLLHPARTGTHSDALKLTGRSSWGSPLRCCWSGASTPRWRASAAAAAWNGRDPSIMAQGRVFLYASFTDHLKPPGGYLPGDLKFQQSTHIPPPNPPQRFIRKEHMATTVRKQRQRLRQRQRQQEQRQRQWQRQQLQQLQHHTTTRLHSVLLLMTVMVMVMAMVMALVLVVMAVMVMVLMMMMMPLARLTPQEFPPTARRNKSDPVNRRSNLKTD